MNPVGLKSFRNRVLAGLILIVPLWVTLLVAGLLYRTIDGIIRPLGSLPIFERVFGAVGKSSPLLELLIVLALAVLLLYLLGLISTTILVRRLYAIGEHIVLKIPLLKTIYVMTKQVLDLLTAGRGTSFKEVVSVEFPKRDSYALGFVTGETRQSDDPRPFVNVFVPTTPNPTSGFLLMVPREAVRSLDLSVEEAVKMIISGGAITPREILTGPYRGLDRPRVEGANPEGGPPDASAAPTARSGNGVS